METPAFIENKKLYGDINTEFGDKVIDPREKVKLQGMYERDCNDIHTETQGHCEELGKEIQFFRANVKKVCYFCFRFLL